MLKIEFKNMHISIELQCLLDLTHTQKPSTLRQDNAPDVLVRVSYQWSVVDLKFVPISACT